MATYTITTNETYHKIVEKGQTFEVYHVSFENASKFANAEELKDALSEPGVYLLIKDIKGESPEVYVGEAEPLRERIKQHVFLRNNKKEFCWTELIVFVNIHNEWSKADVKFIENGLYNELINSASYKVSNSTIPTKSKVIDPSLCQKHIEAIRLLSPFFGHPKLFEKNTIAKTNDVTKAEGPSKETREKGIIKSKRARRFGMREKFWEVLLKVFSKDSSFALFKEKSTRTSNTIDIATGVKGLWWSLKLRRDSLCCRVYIDRKKGPEDNQKILNKLKKDRKKIEKKFGNKLIWDEHEGDNVVTVECQLPGGWGDPEDKWPEIAKEDLKIVKRFVNALKEPIAKLSI